MMTSAAEAIDLPFREAIDFLRQKADVKTRSWRDVWDGAHSKMFMVAGANTDAIVADFHGSILKAMKDGTTLDAFRKDFDRIVKTHGWSYKGERGWRTRVIFETNLRTAYAAGRYAQMTRPETLEAFPYWEYNHSGALHPRLQHKNWDGKCYPADDPFWKVAYPPNGFGCGCFVIPVSKSRLKRLGKDGPDQAPDLDQLGTDQPLGVEPSFAYNPGQAWLAHAGTGPIPVAATEAVAAAFVRSALRGKWPDGSWTPVATLDEATATRMGVAAGGELRLTAETIRAAFAEFDANALATVPRWLAREGKLTRGRGGRWVLRGSRDGKVHAIEIEPGTPGPDGKIGHAQLKVLK